MEMDREALKRLEDRVRTLEGVSPLLGSGNRDNEPSTEWLPDDPRAVDALVERGGWTRTARVLNLDTCRGLGPAERPEAITGLDGLAIELDQAGADRIARRIRSESGDTPAPREVAAELLGLDADRARLLFEGPNWAGKARAWIQPHEAAQAVQHVRRDVPAERVWAHLDRRALAEQHDRERPDAYLGREARARVEHWVSSVAEAGLDDETGLPYADLTEADVGAERERVLEELRYGQAWDSIAPTAEIHPSARIGRGVAIGDFASIGRDAVIGDHAAIGAGASIGDESRIASGVAVLDGAVVGDRSTVSVSVGERAVIGDECVIDPDPVRSDSAPRFDERSTEGVVAYIPAGSQVADRTTLGHAAPEPAWVSEGVRQPAPAPPSALAAAQERGSRRGRTDRGH